MTRALCGGVRLSARAEDVEVRRCEVVNARVELDLRVRGIAGCTLFASSSATVRLRVEAWRLEHIVSDDKVWKATDFPCDWGVMGQCQHVTKDLVLTDAPRHVGWIDAYR